MTESVNEGLSLAVLREKSQSNKTLSARLEQRLSPQPIRMEFSERRWKHIEEQRREKERWIDYIRSKEAALRENRAPPALLHQMAQEYFGDFFKFSANYGRRACLETARRQFRTDRRSPYGFSRCRAKEGCSQYGEDPCPWRSTP